MKKQKMLLASVLLCLMLSISGLAGDSHAGGRASGDSCPPAAQCAQAVDPITNLLTYIWEIIT